MQTKVFREPLHYPQATAVSKRYFTVNRLGEFIFLIVKKRRAWYLKLWNISILHGILRSKMFYNIQRKEKLCPRLLAKIYIYINNLMEIGFFRRKNEVWNYDHPYKKINKTNFECFKYTHSFNLAQLWPYLTFKTYLKS